LENKYCIQKFVLVGARLLIIEGNCMKIYQICNAFEIRKLMEEIDQGYSSGNFDSIEQKEMDLEKLLEEGDFEDSDLEPDIIERDYADEDVSQGGMIDQLVYSYELYVHNSPPFELDAEANRKLLGQIIFDAIYKAGGKYKSHEINEFSLLDDEDVNLLIEIAREEYENRKKIFKRKSPLTSSV
jgi:hypothetical protein